MSRQKTLLISVVTFFIVIPLMFFGFYAAENLLFVQHGYVSLVTIPSPVKITNSWRHTTLNSNQNFPLPVGHQIITLSANGFRSETITITITQNKTLKVPVQLVPLTQAAKNEVSNSKYQASLEQISALKMNQQLSQLSKNNPILNVLPIQTNNYTITSCPGTTQTIAICIDSFIPGTQYMQQEGIEKLKSLGYNLSGYQIYVDGSLYTISD